MGSTFVIFRGEEVEIKYTYSGYDYSVNDSGLEWWFEDKALEESCTDAEREPIDKIIWEIVSDPTLLR